MIYTYKALRDQVLRMIDEVDDPGTETLVKNLMNQAHQARLVEDKWPFMLWDTVETITTVPGQKVYALHAECDRLLYVYNRTTKQYVREVPNRQLGPERVLHDSQVSTGPAANFYLWGEQPVKQQPSAASVLTIVSTDAADTGSTKAIAIKGVDSTDAVTIETIVPNGTTPVSGTTQFKKILAVTKALQWTGVMSLKQGTTTLLQLNGTELGRQYKLLHLVQEPTGAETLEYRFYRKPLSLVNDFDVPEIPAPYSQVLVWDTLLLLAGYTQDITRAALELWGAQQMKWDLALRQAFMDGQTLESGPKFVRYTGDYGGWQ